MQQDITITTLLDSPTTVVLRNSTVVPNSTKHSGVYYSTYLLVLYSAPCIPDPFGSNAHYTRLWKNNTEYRIPDLKPVLWYTGIVK
jgi:hypothetical protein